jgi:Flp pilus assembly protein TadD
MALASMFALELPRAQSEFRKAVACMPGHVGTWHALGWCQLLAKDFDGAAATFEHALSLNHNFAESHGGLAVIDALRGRRAEAQERVRIALLLDANCVSARFAQVVLSGEVRDAASYERVADRVLGELRAAGGADLRAMLARLQRRMNRDKPTQQ